MESIRETIKNSKNLNLSPPLSHYYMHLHTLQGIQTVESIKKFDLELKYYQSNQQSRVVDIVKEFQNVFPRKKIPEIEKILNRFWSNENNENNYISIFTMDSIRIAKYSITEEENLLKSKFKALKDNERETDILVNGDSINQYCVEVLN